MRSWLVLVIACAACRDPKLTRLEDTKRAVCACKTSACADAAIKELPAPPAQVDVRERRLASEIVECLAKLSDRGSADPASPETP